MNNQIFIIYKFFQGNQFIFMLWNIFVLISVKCSCSRFNYNFHIKSKLLNFFCWIVLCDLRVLSLLLKNKEVTWVKCPAEGHYKDFEIPFSEFVYETFYTKFLRYVNLNDIAFKILSSEKIYLLNENIKN